jgi:hypothetical protein
MAQVGFAPPQDDTRQTKDQDAADVLEVREVCSLIPLRIRKGGLWRSGGVWGDEIDKAQTCCITKIARLSD